MNSYKELKEQLNTNISKALMYSTGLACGNLENIQKTNNHRRKCKILRIKIKEYEKLGSSRCRK